METRQELRTYVQTNSQIHSQPRGKKSTLTTFGVGLRGGHLPSWTDVRKIGGARKRVWPVLLLCVAMVMLAAALPSSMTSSIRPSIPSSYATSAYASQPAIAERMDKYIDQSTDKIHPALMAAITRQPNARVPIIVQGQMPVSHTAVLVEQFGGAATRSLHIINAVAAQMRAADAGRLARHPSIRWIAPDGHVSSSGLVGGSAEAPLTNTYLDTLGVRQVWETGIRGHGIGVAVIDSGIEPSLDLSTQDGASRILHHQVFGLGEVALGPDGTGHGTHIGGIIAGNGTNSQGLHQGIAPEAHLLSLRISSATGVSLESDAVAAMQWVLENKAKYNIRVVNLSINAGSESSYHESPIAAAAEVLWFNGIVVVVSSGNNDPLGLFDTASAGPANDPFVITAGASDERGTSSHVDDLIPSYSAAAETPDGFSKPDIIAPGSNIISVLARQGLWHTTKLHRVVDGKYLRLSGTSMSAPMVAAAAALLLESEPELTPDQVKYRLINAADSIQADDGKSYPYLNIYKALTTPTTQSANAGLVMSSLLWPEEAIIAWGNANWSSVNWNSVNWNSVNWNSVNWNSVNWNSVNWNSANWSTIEWNSVFFEEDVAELLAETTELVTDTTDELLTVTADQVTNTTDLVTDLVTTELPKGLWGGSGLRLFGAEVPDDTEQLEHLYLPIVGR